MTSQQLAANLIVLLDREVSSQGEEIMDAIQSSEKTIEEEYQTQQMVVVILDDNDNERYWCLGIYLSAAEDRNHKIDHLESVSSDATNWSRMISRLCRTCKFSGLLSKENGTSQSGLQLL